MLSTKFLSCKNTCQRRRKLSDNKLKDCARNNRWCVELELTNQNHDPSPRMLLMSAVRDALSEDLRTHEFFCFEGFGNTPKKNQSTKELHDFKLNWGNLESKGLSTRMLLKSGSGLLLEPLPVHSVVTVNDLTTQATSTAHDMISSSEISNDNPSTLDSSSEANPTDSTITPPTQRNYNIEHPRRTQLIRINLF